MKFVIWSFALLLRFNVMGQSPHLSILLKMDSAYSDIYRYKIQMKICKPKKMTVRSDWFSHDTSTIDFASLKANDIDCGEYFDKGMPTLISGEEEKPVFNQFEFSNQVFAWEEIYVFRITNVSSRGWLPPMYVVLPIKYKSFTTSVDLNDITFQSGKVIFLNNVNAAYAENGLIIKKSLKNEKAVEEESFPLKELLEKN
jgi:hypothetical protein